VDSVPGRAAGDHPLDNPTPVGDWSMLSHLWRLGVNDAGIEHLLRLRGIHRQRSLALDGYVPDRKAEFIRWMVQQGRVHDD
jgi:hypothetical protein